MNIIGLGYVGLGAPKPGDWIPFARDVIGLGLGRAPGAAPYLPPSDHPERGADGSVYFAADEWSWRLAVHPAEQPGIQYLGFEVGSEKELDQALAELKAAGFPARRGGVAEAQARAVTGIGFSQDPAGNALEFFYAPMVGNGFRSPHDMKFLTGDMGLGHVNLFVQNFEECARFYVDVLGFRLTDYYSVGPDMSVNFFHINPRHHTLGIMKVAPINAGHHIMFETAELDMVGQALDRAMAAGCTITASLGRHSNDGILSFYMKSPSGIEVEIGWGAIRVGPDWAPRFRAPGDLWGHHGLTAENIKQTAEGGQ